VENGANHMLISSNDNQEMQLSHTEGFGGRNVESSGQQFDDLEHPFAQHMKYTIAMNLESSKSNCPRLSHNACCSCLDICLQALYTPSRATCSCSTRHWTIFVVMIKDGPVSVCCRLIVVQNFLLLIIYYHHSLNIFMFLLEQQTSRGD
jgi:hypothetical protein